MLARGNGGYLDSLQSEARRAATIASTTCSGDTRDVSMIARGAVATSAARLRWFSS